MRPPFEWLALLLVLTTPLHWRANPTASRMPVSWQAQSIPSGLDVDEAAPERATLGKPIHRAVSRGAVLYAPDRMSFGADGSFDLVVHFHGGAQVMEPQFDELGFDGALLTLNLGVGSLRYTGAFSDPRALWRLIEGVELTVAAQHPEAKVGRLALSAWSAGYGALSSVLRHDGTIDRVDAVIFADGMHGSFENEKQRKIARRVMDPFVNFAELAVNGDKMMLVTHSGVRTYHYASTTESADYLRRAFDMTDSCTHASPETMSITQCSVRSGLKIVAYEGRGKAAHAAHLRQIGPLALATLHSRWARA